MAGRTQLAPTFNDILGDSITKVAEVYWAPYNLNKKPFDIKVYIFRVFRVLMDIIESILNWLFEPEIIPIYDPLANRDIVEKIYILRSSN